MSFLEKILPGKKAEARALADRFKQEPPRRPDDLPIRDFAAALEKPLAVIAEVKHKSPSNATFRQTASPARLAAAYKRGGAAALSVVTDTENFGTSLADVRAMREASGLPVLVKEFIIDRNQILAAWQAGADAVLLIARMLEQPQLTALLAEIHRLGLQSLVECHDEEDIQKSVKAGARILGINNRNLATLETDLSQTSRLMPLVPEGIIKVSESGIESHRQITDLAAAGADAFLIGHALLLSADPGRKVRELTGLESEDQPRVKICGLTNVTDAAASLELGADILGLIFAESQRQITLETAVVIRQAVPEGRLCGVFLDAPLPEVIKISEQADLDLVQLHGQESPEYCQQLKQETGLPLIKVVGTREDAVMVKEQYSSAAYFLVDLPKTQNNDVELGPDAVRSQAETLTAAGAEVFLAGGLNPGNVGLALSAKSFAVDVSSGVESHPGQKDLAQVAAFIQEVK